MLSRSKKLFVYGIILVIILFVIKFVFLNNKNETFTESAENTDNNKVLNYYGGRFCPHSNENSSMYKLITEKLKEKYSNLPINIYWSRDNGDKFTENNIEYVPTVTNNNNEKIFIGLPEGTDKDTKTDEQLEEILLKNIYDQL